MRSLSRATCTSGEPVSVSWARKPSTRSRLRAAAKATTLPPSLDFLGVSVTSRSPPVKLAGLGHDDSTKPPYSALGTENREQAAVGGDHRGEALLRGRAAEPLDRAALAGGDPERG